MFFGWGHYTYVQRGSAGAAAVATAAAAIAAVTAAATAAAAAAETAAGDPGEVDGWSTGKEGKVRVSEVARPRGKGDFRAQLMMEVLGAHVPRPTCFVVSVNSVRMRLPRKVASGPAVVCLASWAL